MDPKRMLRMGRIFIIVGIVAVLFLFYQAMICPDRQCTLTFAWLSLVTLVLVVVIFIAISLFAMRLWIKADSKLKRKAWSKSRKS